MEILTDAMGSLICLLNPTTCMDAAAEEEKEDEEEPFPLPVREDREKKGFRVKLFNREELGYWWSHMKYIRHLLFPYMVPLFGVYIAEYMINQGLYELFIYPHTHLGSIKINQGAQYRV